MKQKFVVAKTMGALADDDIVVCMTFEGALKLPDNKLGLCAQCGAAIQFRPDVPDGGRKLCLGCAWPLMREAGTVTLAATDATMEVVRREARKREN